MPRYAFDLLDGVDGVSHAVFSRHGGASAAPYDSLNVSSSIGDDPAAVAINRDRVLTALGRPRAGLVMAGLVHGTAVARVDGATAEEGHPLDGGGYYVPDVDALVTDDPAVTLLVTAADCAQVFFVDPVRRVVGLAHAGWRGTAAGMLTATVEALVAHFGSRPADLIAAVGPCLGPCCARFSDPHRELPAWCAPYIDGHYIDLWAMNRRQLLDAGLLPERVAVAGICTLCRRDMFFSHRGDGGRTGRFAAAITLTYEPRRHGGTEARRGHGAFERISRECTRIHANGRRRVSRWRRLCGDRRACGSSCDGDVCRGDDANLYAEATPAGESDA